MSRRAPTGPKPLTLRQQRYVGGVLRGLSKSEAARQAGYGPAYSRLAAARIQVPAVHAAIEHARAELREETMYDIKHAVEEIDKAVRFAYEKSSPISIGKLLELKARLHGLLVDKIDITTVSLIGALHEAQRRVATRAQTAIEVNPTSEHASPVQREPNESRDRVCFPND